MSWSEDSIRQNSMNAVWGFYLGPRSSDGHSFLFRDSTPLGGSPPLLIFNKYQHLRTKAKKRRRKSEKNKSGSLQVMGHVFVFQVIRLTCNNKVMWVITVGERVESWDPWFISQHLCRCPLLKVRIYCYRTSHSASLTSHEAETAGDGVSGRLPNYTHGSTEYTGSTLVYDKVNPNWIIQKRTSFESLLCRASDP